MANTFAFDTDTGETIEIIRYGGRTYRACYGCGGAGCQTCDGEGFA